MRGFLISSLLFIFFIGDGYSSHEEGYLHHDSEGVITEPRVEIRRPKEKKKSRGCFCCCFGRKSSPELDAENSPLLSGGTQPYLSSFSYLSPIQQHAQFVFQNGQTRSLTAGFEQQRTTEESAELAVLRQQFEEQSRQIQILQETVGRLQTERPQMTAMAKHTARMREEPEEKEEKETMTTTRASEEDKGHTSFSQRLCSLEQQLNQLQTQISLQASGSREEEPEQLGTSLSELREIVEAMKSAHTTDTEQMQKLKEELTATTAKLDKNTKTIVGAVMQLITLVRGLRDQLSEQ